MMNNESSNGIRLPSIIAPYQQSSQPPPHQQQQQQQNYINISPATSPITPYQPQYIITRDIPMFQQQQQQQPYTSWSPSHTKSYSLDSIPPPPQQQQQQHQSHYKPAHSKSKSLTHHHQPLSNYEIHHPIQKIPMEKLSTIPLEDLNKIPKLIDIATKKYSTSIDERSFVTVYEYQIENNWIIWDYHTGLVHLTGLWKSIGNKKADIVKLIDSSPELVDIVKRVRGGFLKIQGTWIPYDIARRLACKFCHKIRYSLIPLFGYEFVNDCLKPDQAGFGLLRLDNVTTSGNKSHLKRVRKQQQLQQQQQQQQQKQLQLQIPMTPYYYQQQQQQQLPTPTSSTSSSSSSSSIGFNPFQSSLMSPLEPYPDRMNLPKLHTFTKINNNNNSASNFLQSLNNSNNNQQQQQLIAPNDDESISPKSSVPSTSNTPSSSYQLLKKRKKNRIHKKSNSTSSINLNTVLKLAVKLDYNEKQLANDLIDDDEDDDVDVDDISMGKFNQDEELYGYDKSVIDAASSLMFVSNSWRSNNQQSVSVELSNPQTQTVKEEGKRKSKMDISGLLT